MELNDFLADLNSDARDLLMERVVRVATATTLRVAFPKRRRLEALTKLSNVMGVILDEAVKNTDPLKSLYQQTQGFVNRRVNDKDGQGFQGLSEKFDQFVAARTAYELLRLARGQNQQEAAANLLFGTLLPLIDERGGMLTQEAWLKELAWNGTETVVERWASSPPGEFVDAVKMLRGNARFKRYKLAREQAEQVHLGQFPTDSTRLVTPLVAKSSSGSLSDEKEYFIELVGDGLYPLCAKAASTLPDPVQQLVSLLILGGLSHRANVGSPWRDLEGGLQPELFGECLPNQYRTRKGLANKNVIDQKFRRPLSEAMVALDCWTELADIFRREFPSSDFPGTTNSIAETSELLLELLAGIFWGSKGSGRATHYAAFQLFLRVGEATALRRLQEKNFLEMPYEFEALDLTSSELAGLLAKYLLDGAPPSRKCLAAITDHVSRNAGRSEEDRVSFWRELLANVKREKQYGF